LLELEPEDNAMARPKGSRNKPKSADSNGVGHNSGDDAPLTTGELTDEQRQVLWFGAKRKIVSFKESIASITGELRNEYKKLKADLGLLKSDVDFALSLEDEDAEETHRRRMMLARWEQHPIGLQADMFGDGVDRTPAVDKKRAEGKRHGLAGDPCNPGCDPSSEQYQSYMAGFHEGQAVLAQGIKRPDPPPMDLPHSSEQPADGNPRMSRAEWKAHMAKQNAEVAAEIKAGAIGTEPATAGPE
jgi:hypothetical protein